jgi:adenosylcobinamide-GDP ribazoletransferase
VRAFFTAVSVLTILPLDRQRRISEEALVGSAAYFPVVGLCIGGFLMAASRWLSPLLAPEPLAVILLLLSVLVTGGLHLDGLADLCDGLAAGGNRERILSVMKDSRVGAFGVMGLVIVLFFKYVLFLEVFHQRAFRSFLIMGLLSRWAMVLAAFSGRYARDAGTAKPFIGQVRWLSFVGSTTFTAGVVWMLFKGPGLGVFVSVGGVAELFLYHLKLKIGGLTGDGLGALNELVEVMVLLLILTISHSFFGGMRVSGPSS